MNVCVYVCVCRLGGCQRSCSLDPCANVVEPSACIRPAAAARRSWAPVHCGAITRAPFCSLNLHLLTVVSCGRSPPPVGEFMWQWLVFAGILEEKLSSECEVAALAVLRQQVLLETVRGFNDLCAHKATELKWQESELSTGRGFVCWVGKVWKLSTALFSNQQLPVL